LDGRIDELNHVIDNAEVIKVESERRTDHSRVFSVTMGTRYKGKDESPLFNTLNLNKLDIMLNDNTH